MPSHAPALLSALALAACLTGCEGHRFTETFAVDATELWRLQVDSGAGDVAVYGDDCESVQIFSNNVSLDYEVVDGSLILDGGAGDMLITVPYSFQVEVDTGAGDTTVADTEGSVWIDSGAGDVELYLPGNAYVLDIDTGAGDVNVSGVAHSSSADRWIVIDTGAGDVDIVGR
jgi:DUF4097 and DUF4098 domain-containing protein YvlB